MGCEFKVDISNIRRLSGEWNDIERQLRQNGNKINTIRNTLSLQNSVSGELKRHLQKSRDFLMATVILSLALTTALVVLLKEQSSAEMLLSHLIWLMAKHSFMTSLIMFLTPFMTWAFPRSRIGIQKIIS